MATSEVGPVEAVRCLLAGVSVTFRDRAVRRRAMVPLVVNAVVLLLLFALGVWGLLELRGWLLEGLTGWYWTLLEVFAFVAVVLGLVVVLPTLYVGLASVIFPVFNTMIFNAARRTEAGGAEPGPSEEVVTTLAMVMLEIRRLARLVVFSLLLLPLNLLPVVGSLAYLVATFLLTAHTLAWDLLSYHFELHGMSYREQRAFLKERRMMALSLGAAGVGLILIPVAGLVLLTTNVAGAGILSARLDGQTAAPAK